MKTRPKMIDSGTSKRRGLDPAKFRQMTSPPSRVSVVYATVGHVDRYTQLPEPTPQFIRIEQGQVMVEVTMQPDGDQIIARLGAPAAGLGAGWYINLTFGCRVVVELVRDNPSTAVITARLNDQVCTFPPVVANVQTGAAAAVAPKVSVPAPMWQFLKTGIGELMAIETGPGGDILIHSAASVEITASFGLGTIHLNGRVALGEPVTAPPVGQTAGPAGVPVPGTPAIPAVPIPATPSIPVPPKAIIPYVGLQDGIVRSKDMVQSHAGVDPDFWTWIIAVHSHPLILAVLSGAGITPPLAVHSEHSGAAGA